MTSKSKHFTNMHFLFCNVHSNYRIKRSHGGACWRDDVVDEEE